MVHVAYDRLLARLFLSDDAHLWVLKGAAALIARLDVARHSKDIDLYWAEEGRRLDDAVVQLRRAADRDIGDHFTFTLGAPVALGRAEGVRLLAVASLGPTPYAQFQVDVVAGQHVTAPPEQMAPMPTVELPGLPRTSYRVYPLSDHIADKLCAILETTERRSGERVASTRYKDLVDLVLISTVRGSTPRLCILLWSPESPAAAWRCRRLSRCRT